MMVPDFSFLLSLYFSSPKNFKLCGGAFEFVSLFLLFLLGRVFGRFFVYSFPAILLPAKLLSKF
jgi:hypothetical protein